jgi:CRP/FNR family transcriptional regulator
MQNIPVTADEKLQALRKCVYFSNLEEVILVGLLPGVNLVRFDKGEVLFWQEEPCKGLYILKNGQIKLFKISTQGREFIVSTLEEGSTFSEVPVFDHGLNPVNAAALEESLIWIIDPEILRSAMYKYPSMCQSVVLNLSQNLRKMIGLIEELSFLQVTHRMARLLCQMTPEQLSGEAGTRLTRDQLAARLGTVREVGARALRELERSGAIKVNRRDIRILDEEILRQWAQGPN